MSTYTDLHDRVKESLVVDYRNRVTTQRAKFLNHDNEYWGKFKGQIDAVNVNLSAGQLAEMTSYNEVLIDPKLETSEGTVIDLGGLANEIQALSNKVEETIPDEIALLHEEDTLIRETINGLSDRVSADLQYLSSKISVGSGGYDELERMLCAEINNRDAADIAISGYFDKCISIEEMVRSAADEQLKTDILSEADDREAADQRLSSDLTEAFSEKIIRDRHYIRVQSNSSQYPIKAADYAVNVLAGFDSPLARVREATGGKTLEIAYVYDKDDNTLTIRPYGAIDSELSSALTSDLVLSGYNTVTPRGAFSFKIETLDVPFEYAAISDLTVTVNPADRSWRLVDGAGVKYGTLQDVTIDSTGLQHGKFEGMIEPFDWANGMEFSRPFDHTDENTKSRICFEEGYALNMISGLTLFEQLSTVPEGFSARIYQNSVIRSDDMTVDGFGLTIDGMTFDLTRENGFETKTGDFEYVKFNENDKVISANFEKRLYSYAFESGSFSGALSIHDMNVSLADEYLTSDVSVTIKYTDEFAGVERQTTVKLTKNESEYVWTGQCSEYNWDHTIRYRHDFNQVIWYAQNGSTKLNSAFSIDKSAPIVEILDENKWQALVTFEFNESEPAQPITVTAYKNADVGSHTLQLDQRDTGVRFELPPRTKDVMREAIFVVRPNDNAVGDVRVDFVEADGTLIYTPDEDRKPEFYIPRGKYSVIRLQEVNYIVSRYGQSRSVFQLEDLNDQVDESRIRELMNRVRLLESDVSGVSADLSTVSSKLDTEIERSTLSDEALIEDVCSLSGEQLALSGRYDSTFVSIDKSADQGQHISSDNLVITDVNPDGGDLPAHDRYYMTFEYGTAVLKKIK